MGFSQARILEWAAISSFRGPSWPRDQTCISYICCIDKQILYLLSHLGGPLSPRTNGLCTSSSSSLCFNAVSCGTHNSVFVKIPMLYLRVLCVSWAPFSSWTTVICPAGCYIFSLFYAQSLICFLADNRCLILAEWIESRMKNASWRWEFAFIFHVLRWYLFTGFCLFLSPDNRMHPPRGEKLVWLMHTFSLDVQNNLPGSGCWINLCSTRTRMYLVESGNKPTNLQKAVHEDEEAIKEKWEEQRDRGRKRTEWHPLFRTTCVWLHVWTWL